MYCRSSSRAIPALFVKQAGNPRADAALGQDLGKTAADTILGGKAAAQSPRTVAQSPDFQITKQTGTPNELSQRLANSETAFAARVVQRAGVAATVALRDSQTVISASRFDTPKNGATATDTQGASTVKKSDVSAPQTKAPAEQAAQPATGSQLSGDANSNADSDEKRDTAGADAVSDLRATAGGSQDTPTTVQPAQSNTTGAGTMPAVPPEARNPVAAKATAEPSAPKLMEPQGDNAGRTTRERTQHFAAPFQCRPRHGASSIERTSRGTSCFSADAGYGPDARITRWFAGPDGALASQRLSSRDVAARRQRQ